MTVVVAISLVTLYISFVIWAIASEVQRVRIHRAKGRHEQLRLDHERFVAERRLQQLTNDALQGMLEAARNPVDEADQSDWYRP